MAQLAFARSGQLRYVFKPVVMRISTRNRWPPKTTYSFAQLMIPGPMQRFDVRKGRFADDFPCISRRDMIE